MWFMVVIHSPCPGRDLCRLGGSVLGVIVYCPCPGTRNQNQDSLTGEGGEVNKEGLDAVQRFGFDYYSCWCCCYSLYFWHLVYGIAFYQYAQGSGNSFTGILNSIWSIKGIV